MLTAQYMEEYKEDSFIYCVVMQLSGSPLFYQGIIFVLSVFCAEFVLRVQHISARWQWRCRSSGTPNMRCARSIFSDAFLCFQEQIFAASILSNSSAQARVSLWGTLLLSTAPSRIHFMHSSIS